MFELKKDPDIKIVNVVASASLDHGINPHDIVKAFPGVEYRPEFFPGLVFRIKRPRTATLIFRTGKMVCTRAKSEKEVRRALKKVFRKLKKRSIAMHGKLHMKITEHSCLRHLRGKGRP